MELNTVIALPTTTPLWYYTSQPIWVDGPPLLNIVTSCVSLTSSAALLLRPFSGWLQCQREPGSACQTSTQAPLRFLLSLLLDAVMQDSLPQPAFFSGLLLILAAQCSVCSMQERASCKCNFVEFCVYGFKSELLLQSALVALGTLN